VSVAFVDERARRLGWVIALVFAGVAAFAVPLGGLLAIFVVPTALAKLLFARFELLAPPTRFHNGTIEPRDEGFVLRFGKSELVFGASNTVDGWIEPWPEPTAVLRTHQGLACVRVGSDERAAALLEACGRSPATNLTRMRLESWAATWALGTTGMVLVALTATVVAVFVALVLGFQLSGHPLFSGGLSIAQMLFLPGAIGALVLSALAMRGQLVEIGRDQLVLHGPLRARRVPIASIRQIVRTRSGVVVETPDDTLELAVVPWHADVDRKPEAKRIRDALHARIGASCRLESAAPAAERLRALDLASLPIEARREKLVRLARGGDYRSEGFTTPELVDVVGASEASRADRVAAAWLLSATKDEDALARARDITESLADAADREAVLAALEEQELGSAKS